MKKITIIFLLVSGVFAQSIENIFSNESTAIDKKTMQLNQNINLTSIENLTYTPIGKSIDPEMYILGPGDLLGINIISSKNISLPIRVNPVGEILIPSVGVLNVNGLSIFDARTKISDYVFETALKNAVINVTLLDIRRFKVQVLGAIHSPGYVYVTPVDRVYEAIKKSGGVQKFADPDIIRIIRGEEIFEVKLKDYLSGKDNSQNKLLQTGDIIFIPFNDYAKSMDINSVSYNEHQVTVYGFVNRNSSGNTFSYFSGYTARDYIAMAGGTVGSNSSFPIGNINKTTIYRADGTRIKHALNEIVLPGDMIEVPASIISQIVGNDGVIKTLASIASTAFIVWRISEDL